MIPLKDFVFVFGSNLSGAHGSGAALDARNYRGFPTGLGVGFMKDCYAVPTKDCFIQTIPLHIISLYVLQLKTFAAHHKDLKFQVTRVGCGLAGYTDREVAPLFIRSPLNMYFDVAWANLLPEVHPTWGTFS